MINGLPQEHKAIPPMFFYHERGSRLFDAICRQPEYYLPDAERELDANIDSENFDHRAYYNSEPGRIEMRLVSVHDQQIRIDGHHFALSSGESVHTECSYKYTPDEFRSLAAKAG